MSRDAFKHFLILFLFAVILVGAVTLPHTGLLGFGRDLFIDEAILIDAGVSFWRKGYATYRASALAFDPGVSTGLAGLVLPGAAVFASQSYIAGRLASAFQNALAFAVVAFWLVRWSRSFLAGPWFMLLAMTMPSMVACLVFSQGEFLSFAALLTGMGLLIHGKRDRWAGAFLFLAIHLKLLALIDVVGALAVWALWSLWKKRFHWTTWANLLVGAFLPWIAWQTWMAIQAPESYLQSWREFFKFVNASGTGIGKPAALDSRWSFIWSNQTDFGNLKRSSQQLIVALSTLPFFILAARRFLIRKEPSVAEKMMAAACSVHLAWWWFKSDFLWVRYAYIGLLGSCAMLAIYGGSVLERIPRKIAWAATALAFSVVVGWKTNAGFQEFSGKIPGCGEQLRVAYPVSSSFPHFCAAFAQEPLRYQDW